MQAMEFEASSHGTDFGISGESSAVFRMVLSKSLWNQDFDLAAEQFFPAITKEALDLRVDKDDLPSAIDDNHRIRSGFQ